MRALIWSGAVCIALGIVALGGFAEKDVAPAHSADAKVSYEKDVKPILSSSCYDCHNSKKKKAGVDLQSGFAGVQRIVSPSNPDNSKLFKCLIGKGAKQMPPKNPLPDAQIQTIKAWIAAGAKEK